MNVIKKVQQNHYISYVEIFQRSDTSINISSDSWKKGAKKSLHPVSKKTLSTAFLTHTVFGFERDYLYFSNVKSVLVKKRYCNLVKEKYHSNKCMFKVLQIKCEYF